MQPEFVPAQLAGHPTAVQASVKYGVLVDAVTTPLKPALHKHPVGRPAPLLPPGHPTAVQAPVKYGVLLDAVTTPL